jgi:hypothetical protein
MGILRQQFLRASNKTRNQDETVGRRIFVLDRQFSLEENWGAQSLPLQCCTALAYRVYLPF